MKVGVLGPLEVEVDGQLLDLGAPKPRQVLATLALHRGQPVPLHRLVDALWGDQPPASHAVTVQGYVAGLRKVLEPQRIPRGVGQVIQTTALGYALTLPPSALDATQLESAVSTVSATVRADPDRPWLLTGSQESDESHDRRSGLLDDALATWRGEPYADLDDDAGVAAERERLRDLRTTAVELRELIRIHHGGAAEAARRLSVETSSHPHRERLWILFAAALARADRQVDGLQALRRLRDTLREDLGVDAGPAVGRLETAILRQRLGSAGSAGAAGSAAGSAGTAGASGAAGARPADEVTALRVAVVDDHPVFRMGMTGMLAAIEGIDLVGGAGDAAGARTVIARGVDVVLMDLDLAGESGIDLTREVLRDHPDLRVLVMTMHEDDEHLARALDAGASGYLLKSAEADDILRAIRAVARGELIIGSPVAGSARARLARP